MHQKGEKKLSIALRRFGFFTLVGLTSFATAADLPPIDLPAQPGAFRVDPASGKLSPMEIVDSVMEGSRYSYTFYLPGASSTKTVQQGEELIVAVRLHYHPYLADVDHVHYDVERLAVRNDRRYPTKQLYTVDVKAIDAAVAKDKKGLGVVLTLRQSLPPGEYAVVNRGGLITIWAGFGAPSTHAYAFKVVPAAAASVPPVSTPLIPATGTPQVELTTSAGPIRLELYPALAPQTVANFLQYVRDGHYNGTIFHRVIDGFMIQGGGYDPGFQQKPTRAPIANEARSSVAGGLKNELGTIAMARTRDPNSATAQFFINVGNNSFLNWGDSKGDGNGYTTFGRVVAGLDVVNRIAKTATGSGGPFPRDVPQQPIVIESAKILGAN